MRLKQMFIYLVVQGALVLLPWGQMQCWWVGIYPVDGKSLKAQVSCGNHNDAASPTNEDQVDYDQVELNVLNLKATQYSSK